MLPFVRFIIFVLASILPATTSWGGTLIISSRSTLTISADRIRVDVFAENKGNELAYGVQAYLYIFDRHYSTDAVDQLGVKQNRLFHFEVPLPTDQRVNFPLSGKFFITMSAGCRLRRSPRALLSWDRPATDFCPAGRRNLP